MLTVFGRQHPSEYSLSVIRLISILESALEKINNLERYIAEDADIREDVINPDSLKKLKEGRMPHYLTCFGISDMLMHLLHSDGISCRLIGFQTQKGGVHVALMIYHDKTQFIVGWSKDTIFLSNELTYREIFSQETGGDEIDKTFHNIQKDKLSSTLNTMGLTEFIEKRVAFVIRSSQHKANKKLINQKLRLIVDLSSSENFIKDNGLYAGIIDINSPHIPNQPNSVNARNQSFNLFSGMQSALMGTISRV